MENTVKKSTHRAFNGLNPSHVIKKTRISNNEKTRLDNLHITDDLGALATHPPLNQDKDGNVKALQMEFDHQIANAKQVEQIV